MSWLVTTLMVRDIFVFHMTISLREMLLYSLQKWASLNAPCLFIASAFSPSLYWLQSPMQELHPETQWEWENETTNEKERQANAKREQVWSDHKASIISKSINPHWEWLISASHPRRDASVPAQSRTPGYYGCCAPPTSKFRQNIKITSWLTVGFPNLCNNNKNNKLLFGFFN